MSINLGTDENPQIAYVSLNGGFVDAQVRATDYDTLIAAAKVAELMYEIMETVTDPDTGETTEQGTGEWALARGVSMDHVGSIVITPATYDADGNELTPAVLDTRHHCNIRLASPATEQVDENGDLKWHKWALNWTQSGIDDTQVNASEEAKVLMGVALINPETINSPSRVWL